MSSKPLIVQSNFKVLLETHSTQFSEIRNEIGIFLELIKSPDFFHTYAITEVSLWNGFSKGLTAEDMLSTLKKFSRFPISYGIQNFIQENFLKYGMFELLPHNKDFICLEYKNLETAKELVRNSTIAKYLNLENFEQKGEILLRSEYRGVFKTELVKIGYPVRDNAGNMPGEDYPINKSEQSYFNFRVYQKEAINTFFGSNTPSAADTQVQSGLIVLPCGAGKTVVGIGIMLRLQKSTLIITPNNISLRQWRSELLAKTDLQEEDIGEYNSERKKIKKITLSTYQQLTYKRSKDENYAYLQLFNRYDWGLIIYDEVHMLPANAFRFITGIQGRLRLGLTATLVREDNKEKEVYSLIGPKKYDFPWKRLEQLAFLAEVACYEIKVDMPPELEHYYFNLESEAGRYRLAAENPQKIVLLKKLLKTFKGYRVMIIGQYLKQLNDTANELNLPLITGQTSYDIRQEAYTKFNEGKIETLLVSKIANFAVDLPNAEVAIQISGTFGSRQEEAQRLGRIIRPKTRGENKAFFISLITSFSREEFLAQNRKGFLVAQGYRYKTLAEKDMDKKDISSMQEYFQLRNIAKTSAPNEVAK